MSQSSSPVSSGTIAPKFEGPQKDNKEVLLLGIGVLVLGGLLAAVWYYPQASDQPETASTAGKVEHSTVSDLLKKAAGIIKGSGVPQKDKVGKITRAQLNEIAQKKIADLNAADVAGAAKIIEGTARSMGIVIQG